MRSKRGKRQERIIFHGRPFPQQAHGQSLTSRVQAGSRTYQDQLRPKMESADSIALKTLDPRLAPALIWSCYADVMPTMQQGYIYETATRLPCARFSGNQTR
jgi:hypothetical protein